MVEYSKVCKQASMLGASASTDKVSKCADVLADNDAKMGANACGDKATAAAAATCFNRQADVKQAIADIKAGRSAPAAAPAPAAPAGAAPAPAATPNLAAVTTKIMGMSPLTDAELALVDDAFIFSKDSVTRTALMMNSSIKDGTSSEAKRVYAMTALARLAVDGSEKPAELAKVEKPHFDALSQANKDKVKAKLDALSKSATGDIKTAVDRMLGVVGGGAAVPAPVAPVPAQPVAPSGNNAVGSSESSLYLDILPGFAVTSAGYFDSASAENPAAQAYPINTIAYWGGKKREGNPPSLRYSAALGYSKFIQDNIHLRLGAAYRMNKVQQGFEEPQLGRQVPDMIQDAGFLTVGVNYAVSKDFSVFADAGIGAVRNSFNITGNDSVQTLQTSPQATQSAFLNQLNGWFIAGKVKAGASHKIAGIVSVVGAFELYGDGTNATSRLEGGGTVDFGTKGPEATVQIGLRVSK